MKLSFYETDEGLQTRQLLLGAFVARLMLAAVCVFTAYNGLDQNRGRARSPILDSHAPPAKAVSVNLTAAVSDETATQFRASAKRNGTNVSALLGSLITQYLANV